MGAHHHHHGPGHAHDHARPDAPNPEKNIFIAFLLNLSFTLIEIIGGFLTGSVAILADAVHDLGDTLSLAMALVLQRFSRKRRDAAYSYGYSRYSLLSALVSALLMVASSLFVLQKAWEKLQNPSKPHVGGMLVVAFIGIIGNGWAAMRLSHGRTQNEKVLKWHLWEDAFGWVAIFIGGVVIYWKEWLWVDPVLALGLSLFILWNIIKNLRQTIRLFLQGKPEGFSEEKLIEGIRSIVGVVEVHDFHVWSLDGARHILSMHIVLDSVERGQAEIKKQISVLARKQGEFHLTIETEIQGEICRETC